MRLWVFSIALALIIGMWATSNMQAADGQPPANGECPINAAPAAPAAPAASTAASAASTAASASSPTTQKLGQLNATFRGNYATAKQEILRTLGPIIFVTGDQMTLLYKGQRKSAGFIPDKYTYLKEVDHVPLACYVYLINKVDRPLSAEELKDLRALCADIVAAKELVAGTTSGDALEVDRQLRQLQSSADFLNGVIENKQVQHSRLRTFVRGISRDTIANVHAAVAAQLKSMQTITDKWRADIPAEDWSQLHVVLATGHMPRQRLSTFQFFTDYLQEKAEGRKIIVMEGQSTEEQGLDLLATHILDEKIALDYFNDRDVMHSDLLSGGAHQWLHKHKVGH